MTRRTPTSSGRRTRSWRLSFRVGLARPAVLANDSLRRPRARPMVARIEAAPVEERDARVSKNSGPTTWSAASACLSRARLALDRIRPGHEELGPGVEGSPRRCSRARPRAPAAAAPAAPGRTSARRWFSRYLKRREARRSRNTRSPRGTRGPRSRALGSSGGGAWPRPEESKRGPSRKRRGPFSPRRERFPLPPVLRVEARSRDFFRVRNHQNSNPDRRRSPRH
jgi:hypothetical protein